MNDIVKRLNKSIAVSEIIGDNPILFYDAANEIERLRAENGRIKAAFRVNMLRAFPNMSHEEIDAEINRILENGDEIQS